MDRYIKIQELKHNNNKVFFAYRSMVENYNLNSGKADIPHMHDFYTIIFVKEAYGSHFIDFSEYKIIPGSVFFVSPGQVHQIVVQKPDPEGDILMFNEEFLAHNFISESFIKNIGLFSCTIDTPPLELPDDALKTLTRFSEEIREAFNSDSSYKFEIISSYLKLFFIECIKYSVIPDSDNTQKLQSGRQIIFTFKDLLKKNYKDWHKVSEYAEEMNISPDYLNSVLKNNLGKSSKELITDRIILEAKRLGLHTELSTKEIAYQLGYEDPSHFSKLFKNQTRESFSDFRNNLNKKMYF